MIWKHRKQENSNKKQPLLIKGSLMAGAMSVVMALSMGGSALAASGPVGPVIRDGKTVPVIPYTSAQSSTYTNEGSDILRFCVWVETDYDTDLDGMNDLVKAFVQVPRAAVEGRYEAPVILAADPYAAGINEGNAWKDVYDMDPSFRQEQLFQPGGRRAPAAYTSCSAIARVAKSSDWYYQIGSNLSEPCYSNISDFDYFLVRGYAVVISSGLGSAGSEGINVVGSRVEAESYKNIVEWLHGDAQRMAYSNKTDRSAVKADWSNGKIAMVGGSYRGTMAYEVATTGVAGLETIITEGGIASWYAYSNTQGIRKLTEEEHTRDYIAALSKTCSSRFFDPRETSAPSMTLLNKNIGYMIREQLQLRGDYGEFWASREFSKANAIKASALIVQGLQDVTVKPAQARLMQQAFQRSGACSKVLLHQGGHYWPAGFGDHTDVVVGIPSKDTTFLELTNLWLSHYLLGAENGVEKLPAVMAQSNVDGTYKAYGSLEGETCITLAPEAGIPAQKPIARFGSFEMAEDVLKYVCNGTETANSAVWSLPINGSFTIQGSGKVHLRLSPRDMTEREEAEVAVVLLDRSDTPFSTFYGYNGYPQRQNVIETYIHSRGLEPGHLVRWIPRSDTKSVISYGFVDLRNPSSGGDDFTKVHAENVQNGEWYDYTVDLQPTIYTLRPGHTLELYILPYFMGSDDFRLDVEGLSTDQILYYYKDAFVNAGIDPAALTQEQLRAVAGAYIESVLKVGTYTPDWDYHDHGSSFVLDNTASYAEIPFGR